MAFHFTLLAIIPTDSVDVYEEVERLLAPYSYGLEVEEYLTECYCVKNKRSNLAWKEVAPQGIQSLKYEDFTFYADNPETAARLLQLNDQKDPLNEAESTELEQIRKQVAAAYQEFREPFNLIHWAAQEKERSLTEPVPADPECEDCNGTGLMKSTVNPQAKFCSWSIGVRFDQDWDQYARQDPVKIPLRAPSPKAKPTWLERLTNWWQLPKDEYDPRTFCEGNVFAVRSLIDDCPTPYAIVSPDGKWYGWDDTPTYPIAVRQKKDAEWDAQCKHLYETFAGNLAVLCAARL